ncbi:hypothetical protein SFRURICE_016293 [Spodoptera frugiperda]|nr:hypothetical protein SFRURICE_016293 [Spodoptera frugiperda]
MKRCVLWMHVVERFPTIDTSHTRTAYLSISENGHIVSQLSYYIFRCVILHCCGCVWLPPIIFIGTHSLAMVETYSIKLCNLFRKIRAMNGFLNIHKYIDKRQGTVSTIKARQDL